MKPRCFLKDHSWVVQQEALLQGYQKGWCTVVLISLKNGKEKKIIVSSSFAVRVSSFPGGQWQMHKLIWDQSLNNCLIFKFSLLFL